MPSGFRNGRASSSSAGVWARACSCSGSNGGNMWPAIEEMTIPAAPGAITRPNSSNTSAVPSRSTASTVAAGARAGEAPAVWTTWVTLPSSPAFAARACTDSREETSTRWVLTRWPRSSSAAAAAAWLSSLMSAKTMCLPGPWRRAMAWPMPPAPVMTRTSSFLLMSDLSGCGVRVSGGVLGQKPQRGGAVLGVGDRVDDLRVAAAVLAAVGGVDGVEDRAVGVLDDDVALDAARGNARPVAAAGDAVPALVGSVCGADKEVVAGAHDPDRRGAAQLAVAADRRDLKLLGVGDPLKLVVGPGSHRNSWVRRSVGHDRLGRCGVVVGSEGLGAVAFDQPPGQERAGGHQLGGPPERGGVAVDA